MSKNKVQLSKAATDSSVVRRKRSDEANRRALRSIVIDVKKAADGEIGPSKSIDEDPFVGLGYNGEIIEPPFDLLGLAMLEEQNTELTPVLETMEANIDGFGHHLVCRVDMKTATPELKKEIVKEKVMLTNFFNYANMRDSFTKLRKKRRKDYEATGNAYWEVTRSASGKVQGFTHLPSYQMRLGRVEKDPVEVEIPTLQLQEDGSFEIEPIKAWPRFRRFVQSSLTMFGGSTAIGGGYSVRWFKEFGDPRTYDNETGKVVSPRKVKNWDGKGTPMPESRKANEVIHWKHYSTRTPYGLPRYIGSLLSIYGSRASEEINYTTLRNNNVPSMVVLVSNGMLTEGSVGRIESFVESQVQSSDNYSKFLIIEAEGLLEGEESGNAKVEIKPLTSSQLKDAMFQNYQANNQDNVRRSFRVPPIFVGKSEEYSRSTADTSRRLADEQVFAPERDEFDEDMNRMLFPAMGVRYHKFKSNSPNTTDNSELVKILSGGEKSGALTPRIARMVLEDILGTELPDFTEDSRFDADLPFSLLMAEAVQNKAMPNEVGQQVTALKAAGLIDDDGPDLFEPTVEEVVVNRINKLRKSLESSWEAKLVEAAHDAGLALDEAPL